MIDATRIAPMAQLLVVALLLWGCRSHVARPRLVEAARPVDLAPSVRELPPSTRAAMNSPPRSEWPCALDIVEDQGFHSVGRAVFNYGRRNTCRIPVSLVAQGIWGCPESYTRTDADGVRYERTFEYDDGRLVAYVKSATSRFVWDGDRLAKTERYSWGYPEGEVASYRERDGEVVAFDEQNRLQESILYQDGRPVLFREYLFGRLSASAVLEWGGDSRPRRVEVDVTGPVLGHVSRAYVYHCP